MRSTYVMLHVLLKSLIVSEHMADHFRLRIKINSLNYRWCQISVALGNIMEV